jgi:hypothetical protein
MDSEEHAKHFVGKPCPRRVLNAEGEEEACGGVLERTEHPDIYRCTGPVPHVLARNESLGKPGIS